MDRQAFLRPRVPAAVAKARARRLSIMAIQTSANRRRFSRHRAGRQQGQGVESLLSNQAYELVRKDIIQCRLLPGAEISETALTKLYGFGKAPIRAALLRLSQDQLISSMPRRGYVVTPITIRNVQEVYGLRLIIEPAAARLATSRCNIPELSSLCERLRRARRSSNKLEFLEAHFEFHVAIARSTGNDRLTHLISSLLHDMARIIHFGEFPPGRVAEKIDVDQGQEEHETIVQALASGDPRGAERVMREHVEHALAMVKEAAFANSLPVRI